MEFYRGNIEGRGDSLEYYGAAAQIATRPVTRALIGASLPSPASSPASSLLSLKVLSTQPHINAKLQYYGAGKTTYSSKAGALPTGQVGNDLITRCITFYRLR